MAFGMPTIDPATLAAFENFVSFDDAEIPINEPPPKEQPESETLKFEIVGEPLYQLAYVRLENSQ
jgi:hypothetical protein